MSAPTSHAYQWKSGGADATGPGATTASYTPVAADVGKSLTCVVRGSNAAGSTPATSAATGAVATVTSAATVAISLTNTAANWSGKYGLSTITTSTAESGAGSLLVTPTTSTATFTYAALVSPPAATAGKSYSASAYCLGTKAGRSALVQLVFYDSSYNTLATASGTAVALTADKWTLLASGPATAPASTAYVNVLLYYYSTAGTDISTSDISYWSATAPTSVSVKAADFTDNFTSFNSAKWWPCYPYDLGGITADGSGSWYAGSDAINGVVVDPFKIVSDSSATDGSLIRVTCRKASAAEQSSITALMAQNNPQGGLTGVPASANQWISGIMVSVPGWSSGYAEWRARFPAAGQATGMWPALWLAGQTETGSSNGYTYTRATKVSSELDILEIFGDPLHWQSTVHAVNSAGSVSNDAAQDSTTDDNWHRFGVEWDGVSVIRFYYDRVLVGTGSPTDAALLSGQPLTARINITTTNNVSWAGEKTGATPTSFYFDVDYFHHYASRPF